VIVPCIDLQNGYAVQLVRGRRRQLVVDDVLGLLDRFRDYGIVHIIDLDAAMRRGSNARLVRSICRRAAMLGLRTRVGGGIRTVEKARCILSWGAEKIIIGSSAFCRDSVNQNFLRRLVKQIGRQRLVVALDAEGGHIVVRGWRSRLRWRPQDVMAQLEPYCSEFLCTYVDREGTLRGTNLAWFRQLRGATRLPITAAGGISSLREVRELSQLGMSAAIGMALYRDCLR
jgi:phosphoribosylformimino-5-aminoimidazole carboxamide ribotide isomerase